MRTGVPPRRIATRKLALDFVCTPANVCAHDESLLSGVCADICWCIDTVTVSEQLLMRAYRDCAGKIEILCISHCLSTFDN